MVVLGEFQHSGLQQHVIQPPLLARPLGGLVVAPPPVPVRVILLVLGNELTLLALVEDILAAEGWTVGRLRPQRRVAGEVLGVKHHGLTV